MSTVTEADAKAPSATCSLRSKRGKMWSSRGVGSRLPGSVKLKSQRKPSSRSPSSEQGCRGGVSRAQTCFGKRARRAFNLYLDTSLLAPVILQEATSETVEAFIATLSPEQLCISRYQQRPSVLRLRS